MEKVIENFLTYVTVDTESSPESTATPSTAKQHDLAKLLVEQLQKMGAEEIAYDKEHCYVYASVPASKGCEDKPVIGFIAHMDTSPAMSGAGVKPRIIENYDGKDIVLNQEKQMIMRVGDCSLQTMLILWMVRDCLSWDCPARICVQVAVISTGSTSMPALMIW